MTPSRILALTLGLLALPSLCLAAGKTWHDGALSEDGSLTLSVDGDLSICDRTDCLLWIAAGTGKKDKELLLLIDGEGKWEAFTEDEDYEDKKEEEDEAEETEMTAKLDAIRKKNGWPTSDQSDPDEELDDEAWKELPILTVEERRAKVIEETKGAFRISKASGQIAADGEARDLVLAAELLPSKVVYLSTNGFWGLSLGEQPIGSPAKMGGVKIRH